MIEILPPHNIAALDLGSLTTRLLVAETNRTGGFDLLVHRREITGLAQGLAATMELAPEGMLRTLAALKRFQQVMAAHQTRLG